MNVLPALMSVVSLLYVQIILVHINACVHQTLRGMEEPAQVCIVFYKCVLILIVTKSLTTASYHSDDLTRLSTI